MMSLSFSREVGSESLPAMVVSDGVRGDPLLTQRTIEQSSRLMLCWVFSPRTGTPTCGNFQRSRCGETPTGETRPGAHGRRLRCMHTCAEHVPGVGTQNKQGRTAFDRYGLEWRRSSSSYRKEAQVCDQQAVITAPRAVM